MARRPTCLSLITLVAGSSNGYNRFDSFLPTPWAILLWASIP